MMCHKSVFCPSPAMESLQMALLAAALTSAMRWSQSEEHHSTDDCCRNTIILRAVDPPIYDCMAACVAGAQKRYLVPFALC